MKIFTKDNIPGFFWIAIIGGVILNICMIVWLYEIREYSKTHPNSATSS
jgi:hypothetical protein